MANYYGTGITNLDALRQEIVEVQKDNFDCYVDNKSALFNDGRVYFPEITMDSGKVYKSDPEWEYWMTPNHRAWSHLREKFGMPDVRWLEKQPQALQDYVFNARVALTDQQRIMLRGYKDNYRETPNGLDYDYNLRGVLSNQYTRFDNLDMVDMLIKAEQDANITNSFVANLRMDRDYISFWYILKDWELGNDPRGGGGGANGNGSPLYPGAKITNGEVGNSSAWIQGGSFTGWCSNGMASSTKSEEAVSFRHRSRSRAGMMTRMAEELTYCLAFSIPATEAYIASYGELIVGDSLKDLVAQWGKKKDLSEEVQNSWILQTKQEAMNRGSRDITWGDLINGITTQVHTLDSDASADSIAVETYEGIGGDLLRELFGRKGGKVYLPSYAEFKAEYIAEREELRLA